MKFSRIIILLLAMFIPHIVIAQNNVAAERAWKPFIAAFRAAVKKRDRAALTKMMAEDFFTSGGIGDDNQDGDSRDETFEFWGEPHTRGWEAFDKVLARGQPRWLRGGIMARKENTRAAWPRPPLTSVEISSGR